RITGGRPWHVRCTAGRDGDATTAVGPGRGGDVELVLALAAVALVGAGAMGALGVGLGSTIAGETAIARATALEAGPGREGLGPLEFGVLMGAQAGGVGSVGRAMGRHADAADRLGVLQRLE